MIIQEETVLLTQVYYASKFIRFICYCDQVF